MKIAFFLLIIISLISHNLAQNAAYFVMVTSGDQPNQDFIIKLNDPLKIQHARDLISGATTDAPSVMGTIVKNSISYNQEWSFFLDPDTISFFDMAIEVCDATTEYTEEHLNEVGGAFLPDNRWCPWTSRIVSEVADGC